MTEFKAPLQDLLFLLNEVLDYRQLFAFDTYAHADADVASAALHEGAKFAEEVIAPLNVLGDQQGAKLVDGQVELPAAFRDAYQQYFEAGWPTLDLPLSVGGQQLPHIVQAAFAEMLSGACTSFSMLPCCTRTASWLLNGHADGIPAEQILPRLVSGQWGATICLSEPQAGSDLARIRTQAVQNADGSYKLTGTKIFISFGDHDLTEQIVHMALARTPDAAAGTRGLTVFAVPKRRINNDGTVGERNGVSVSRIEPKMGLKASPTCVLNFDDAIAYRVGAEGAGLKTMFTMANLMRLEVGVEGIAVAGAATHAALQYASERPQGGKPSEPAPAITTHADVRRMLLIMRARTEAFRALNLEIALQLDVARAHPLDSERSDAQALAEWLLPIGKTGGSEAACEVSNLAVQVFGGHGYISEGGVEQYVRDSRVMPIFEGTNGIQAIDLVMRKLLRDGGQRYRLFAQRIEADLARFADNAGVESIHAAVQSGLDRLESCTAHLQQTMASEPRDVEAAATPFMQLTVLVTGAWMWLRMAGAARADTPFAVTKRATAAFYAEYLMPEAGALEARVRSGARALDALDDETLVGYG